MVTATRTGQQNADQNTQLKSRRKPRYIKPTQAPILLSNRPEFECNWCHRKYSKETTLASHLCEQRRRWLQKDTPPARLGLEAFLEIQEYFHQNRLTRTEEDFRNSDYYLACMRWGRFVISIKCADPIGYLKWLLKNNVGIDDWSKDELYDYWLQYTVFIEDAWDSVSRSIKSMTEWAEDNGKEFKDYFRQAQTARIITDVRKGFITGWTVLCSESGCAWAESLEQSDLDLVWAWLEAPQWAAKFQQAPDTVRKIKEICAEAGL